MANFSYKAKNPSGQTVTGRIDATDSRSVSATLRGQGLFVIDIQASLPSSFLSWLTGRFFQKIDFSELTNFTRQMAVMISTGLTITEALSVLRNQAHNQRMQKLLEDLIVAIEGGISFSKALMQHKNVFSDIYIAVVASGEASGLLDNMLTRLADTLDREREFRGKTRGALVYPAVILVGMGIIMTIMMVFVVPQLSSLYDQLTLDLPLPTKIVVAISQFFVNFWYIAAALILGGFFGFSAWKKSESGRFTFDGLSLKIPAWGKLQEDINLAEFTRTLGLLVGSGTPIIEALGSVGRAARNLLFAEAITRVARRIEKGLSLGSAFSQEEIFPPLIAQMARVGEETGKVDEVMLKISVFYEQEAERRVKTLTTLFEPLIMVVLGISVGFLIVSVILPIYNLTKAF